jgi:hypothetical protein
VEQLPEYLKRPGQRPGWLRVDRLLGEWRVAADNAAGRRHLAAGLEQRRELERSRADGDFERLRRGWYWGPPEFREQLLERIGEQRGPQHYGEELRASEEQKAERQLRQMLRLLGWTEQTLQQHRKGGPQKARLAGRLRSETTMTWPWIANRLSMGHWRTAANAVRATLQSSAA